MSLFALVLACVSAEVPGVACPAAPPAGDTDVAATYAADSGDTASTVCPSGESLGLTYEIYVRSFQDTDGDGIGDLEGVRVHLDYLDDLGVRTLWLMPLFPSVGPAGYDVTDFDQVKAEYGDDTTLAALVADAHARDMRVLVDLPINHVARTHPWFVPAEADPSDPAREDFLFSDTQWDSVRWFPADGGGYYYGFFGSELPDLDWTREDTRDRMLDVFASWLAIVDGYRLDAVTTLIEADGEIRGTDDTHALLAELYALAREENPVAVLLAEASEDQVQANVVYLGSADAPESDRVIDFPRRRAMLDAIDAGAPEPLLEHLHSQADAGALGRTSPFLSSHDLSRLPAYVSDAAARRVLQVMQLLLPGDPILYYGEELDLADATSGTGQDYQQRAPMPWDDSHQGGFTTDVPWFTPDPGYLEGKNAAALSADPESLLNLVRQLACVRDDLDDAGWEVVATDAASVFAFVRTTTEEGRLLVVANLGAAAVGDLRVDAHGAFRELTAGEAGVDAGDRLAIAGLAPYGYALFADEIAVGCAVSPAP